MQGLQEEGGGDRPPSRITVAPRPGGYVFRRLYLETALCGAPWSARLMQWAMD